MLYFATADGVMCEIAGRAHIVISLDSAGKASLQAYCNNRFDSTYFTLSDARLLERELPKLLAELRSQIAQTQAAGQEIANA